MNKDRAFAFKGSLPEVMRRLREQIPDFDERCRKFWLAWKQMMDQRLVARMGYVKMHFYADESVQPFLPPEKPINDAEHVFGLVNAVMLFREFFGKYIPYLCGYQPDWLGYIEQVIIHEIGEVKIGDWTDDGGSDRDEKDRLEQAALDNYLRLFPMESQEKYQRQFTDLRDGNTNMKLFDKEAFLLGIAYYKSKGIVGSLKNKNDLTDQDRANCERTKSYRPFDNIFADLLMRYRNFSFLPFIVGINEAIYAEEYSEYDSSVTDCIPGAPPASVRSLY